MFGTWILRSALVAVLAAGAVHAVSFEPVERPAASVTHRVESGETLWTIARELDPSGDPRPVVDELMRLNDLPSPQIFAGQRLALPA